jgi:hypothetical protein
MVPKRGDRQCVGTKPDEETRPMKVVVDSQGRTWLCDMDVDESKDLEEQGCWRCPQPPPSRKE